MKAKYPIYIPSKNRADSSLTAKIFKNENIDFKIVIEPQDLKEYKKYWTDDYLLVMPENNMGMSYARRWCKKHSKENNHLFHWQFDDNIKGFKERINNKNVNISPLIAINKIETFIDKYQNIGQGGFRHILYAWTMTKDYSLNQQCVSAIITNNQNDLMWRDNVIEDTDYSLQLLTSGFCTINFNRLIMDKLPSTKLTGGNTESYQGDGRYKLQKKLMYYWPRIFKVNIKNGRSHIKPSRIWSTFKQTPILK